MRRQGRPGGGVRGAETAVVGYMLARRQPTVEMQGVELRISVELLHDELRLRGEMRRILGRPPVAQVPGRVVMAAFVIQAVGELMPRPTGPQRPAIPRAVGPAIERPRRRSARGDDRVLCGQ